MVHRKEAVRLASLPGRTAVSVAKELGVSAQQIRNWKRQFTRLSDKQFNTLERCRLLEERVRRASSTGA
ncbi:transposase [Vibrio rotiferianus]|uniref:transposase n=1 Tax=Vibrio rotiferianus TaxID=190895 RepID=UPI00406A5171